MNVLDIKGVRIGEGRPKTIVSLMAQDESEIPQELARLAPTTSPDAVPDCIEWRADFFAGIRDRARATTVCRRLTTELSRQPLIFTLRTTPQGGNIEMPAEVYVSLYHHILEQGQPDLVDIELGIGDEKVRGLIEAAHRRDVRAIVSHHDFATTPSTQEMTDLLVRMAELGADIPKLAVMAHDDTDAARLMAATTRAAQQTDTPLLTMAMGAHGTVTRIRGEEFGSTLTFCALGRASAPGQVELSEAILSMDQLHQELTTGGEA